ncbi:unnamed protein product [Owenia fusiformis]|uniref:Uncharacterized protein n=1 Tax=Owenia fusiformis TaxID=6347 RepID=A0A8J1Y3F5_OWEFU|nr:unnamed protein product [Owenia fusiformis]
MTPWINIVVFLCIRGTFQIDEDYDNVQDMILKEFNENAEIHQIRDAHQQQNISVARENEMEKKICDQKMRTCKGRCGVPKNTSSLSDFYCQCDDKCAHYQDCCVDFESECNININISKYGEQTGGQRSKHSCIKISPSNMVYMDETCASDYIGSALEEQCRSRDTVLGLLPAYDNQTETHYRNVFCARCNDVQSAVLWETKYSCVQDIFDESDFQSPGTNTLWRVMSSPFCSIEYVPPLKNHLLLRPCIPTISRCPEGTNSSLANLCAYSNLDPFSTYRQQYSAYHNWYCYMCTETDWSRPTCTVRLRQISLQRSPDLSLFSFSVIVDVRSDTEMTLRSQVGHGIGGLNVKIACKSDDRGCKALTCPKAYEQVGHTCKLISIIVPVQISCNFSMRHDRWSVYQITETYIKDIFDPIGFILKTDFRGVGKDFRFRFNTSFPEKSTFSQISTRMASDSKVFKGKVEISLPQLNGFRMTYDMTFVRDNDTHVTQDFSRVKKNASHIEKHLTSCGLRTSYRMAGMLFVFLYVSRHIFNDCFIW